ncbi:MAG: hypothetical protein ACREQL_16560 [Candidatus Binatia bacterium]
MTPRQLGATVLAVALVALAPRAGAVCAPSASGIFPASGIVGTQVDATIEGAALSGATITVVGDGGLAATVQSTSDLQVGVRLTIDAAAPVGERILIVDTPGGSAAVSFTVNPAGGPIVAAVSPPLVGILGQPLDVTLTGANLGAVTTGAIAVSGSGVTVTAATPSPDGTSLAVTFTVDAAADLGTHAITISNGIGSVVLQLYVQRPAPVVALVSPAAGEVGAVVPITITGTDLTGAALVITGTDVAVSDVATPADTMLTATLTISPLATPSSEARLLIVTTESGQTTIEFFVVAPDVPTVTSILPGAGEPGETVAVTLHGLNFTGATVTEVSADISLQNQMVVDDETITLDVVVGGGATVDTDHALTVTNGSGFGGTTFRVIPVGQPFVAGLRPPFGNRGALVFLRLDGRNLTGTTSVLTSGPKITESNVLVLDDLTVQVTLDIDPTASIGYRDVTLTTGVGSFTKVAVFRVNIPGQIPSITDVMPTLVEPGATTPMTVTGSNFAGGSVLVTGPGATVTNVVVDPSGTIITFDLTLAPDAPAETRGVIVVTENGTARCNIASNPSPPPFTPAKLVKAGALFTVDSTAFRLFVFEFSINDLFAAGARTAGFTDADGSLTLTRADTAAIEQAFRDAHRGSVRVRAITATNRIAVSTGAVIRR